MDRMERRDFIKRSSSIVAAAPLIGTSAGWSGANDRLRVAVVGMGGRGGYHMNYAAGLDGVEVATICDPDERRTAKWAAELESKTGKRPATEFDLRRVMDDPNIDAVMIASSNHWHALASIYASQAGKHSYVEKPVPHKFFEGPKMVAAARKYNCMVQGGTQRRSYGRFRKAIQLLRDGILGDLYLARWIIVGFRGSIGFKEPKEAPPWLHWDIYRGPAPKQPYHENLVHYNWHWFWDFGNGEMGNNGSHYMDILRWGLNKGLPTRIHSAGGRFGYDDQGQTPNTQAATFQWDDGTLLTCQIRGLYTSEPSGMHFYGSKGYMHVDGGGKYTVYLGRNKEPEPDMGALEHEHHTDNWIRAIREGDRVVLNAEIEETFLSCALCIFANISYRVGRELRFNPATRQFIGDDEANALLTRPQTPPFVVPEKV